MPTRTFAITADDNPVVLDTKGVGEITITVANTTSKPIRGLAKIVPLGKTDGGWLKILGEKERSFSAGETHQIVVCMTAPDTTAHGKYPFRLNLMSVQNPFDDYTEGPTITFALGKEGDKNGDTETGNKPGWWERNKNRVFWTILGLLVVGGTVTAWRLMDKKLQAAFEQSVSRGFAPLPVKFTNLTTETFESAQWNFGDGAVATGRDAEHTFDQSGTYVVTLLVAGKGKGQQSFATNSIEVVQRALAQFQASTNSAPLTVTFDNQSTGDDLTWRWDFGNGNTSTEREPPDQTYSLATNYTVRLIATGPQLGGEPNVSSNVTVVRVVAPPRADITRASFTATPRRGERPLIVKFTDRSVGNPNSWQWQFGDGETSSEQSPTHRYSAVKSYDVTLEVSGPGGKTRVTHHDFIVVQEAIRRVPVATGVKLPEAQRRIEAAGLTVGKVTKSGFFGGFGGLVIAQKPEARAFVRAGDKVNLTVTN